MVSPAIPESPTARLLLELATQRASCEVPFGQRVLVLCDGQINDVECSDGDTTLDAFLVAAGRLDEREREAVVQLAAEQGVSVEQAVLELGLVEPDALLELRRALLLGRLVRALADHEAADAALPQPRPLRPAQRGPSFDSCSLVLDALARRAALGPAEQVGALRRARFVWTDSALERLAASWAELGDIPHAMSVATLFPRHPAAASRIAALVAAGLARLDVAGAPVAEGTLSSRPPRDATSRPPQEVTTHLPQVVTSRPVEVANQAGSTVPMPGPELRGPLELDPPTWWLPAARDGFDDPLWPLEERVSAAEARGTPAERASAWLALAKGFRSQQRSLLEATRAAREAAAAAADHPEALALAAELCAASGQPELAYPYAMAWAAHAPSHAERARALADASVYARRQGRADAALVALRGAASALPEDLRLAERLARALAEQGEIQAAVELAQQCAERLRPIEPERALQLLAWAARLAPANLRSWNQLAKLLQRTGKAALAIATLAHAARKQSDAAARERLRATAVGLAEQAGDLRTASALSLASYDAGHGQPESLAGQLRAAEAWPELAVIAEQAAHNAKGSERANLLVLAAEAHMKLSGGAPAACQLLADALCADPEYTHASEALTALAASSDGALLATEALERALRAIPAGSGRRAVAQRLLAVLSEDASAPLAGWLHAQLPELALPVALAERHTRFELRAQELEHALRSAPSHERTRPALQLAAWARRDPARRALARKLYDKVLEREPEQREALAGLESLLVLEQDSPALLALLERRAEREATPSAQLALAYGCWRAGKPQLALDAAVFALPASGPLGAARPEEHEACVLAWRLAVALGNQAKAEQALRAWAERGPTAATRAAAWLWLAQTTSSREQARADAQAALANDPSSADAALMLLDDLDQLAGASSIPVLRALRVVVGDQPDLLRALARAAFAASDASGQREALEALSALVSDDGFAARALVALRTTGRDAEALAQALLQALAPARFSAQTNYVAQRGLARLGELSGAERALELALSAIEALGEPARPLLEVTDTLAASIGSHLLRAAQLELRAAHASEAERPALLRKLAALHREHSAGWAAVRCELRLLELEPDDRQAVEHLVTLYAEQGALDRLRGALELLVESAPSTSERRARLLDCALVSARAGDDSAAAALLAERALAEGAAEAQLPSREELRRGFGLLIECAPRRAFAALVSLAQRAPSELSRDLLAEAVVLAEVALVDPPLALTAASQGAFRHPDHEPFVRALERLSARNEQPDLVVSALDAAADRCEQPERQAELLARAAKLSEERLDDPGRACLQLDRAYRATPTKVIEELWMAAAARLFARDVRAGKRAYDRLRDTLHVRAKFGSALARVAALTTLARLAGQVYLNRDDAIGYAEAARAALDGEQSGSAEERAAARAELDELSARLGLEPTEPLARANANVRRSLAEAEAPLLGLLNSAPTLRPGAGSLAPPGAHAARVVAKINVRSEPPVALGALAAIDIRSQGVAADERPQGASSVIVSALLNGDGAAHRALSELLSREREAAAPLCAELLTRARQQGFNVAVLRALRLTAAGANRHALWRTSSQALAHVEGALRPPPGPKQRDLRAGRMEHALLEARRCEHAGVLALLAQIAESASPLFRRTPASALGLTKEPEPVRTGAHAQVLTELTQIFAVKHEAYLARNADNRVSVFSVQPSAFLIGGRTPPDANELRFRLARAFEYARNENVLVLNHDASSLGTLFRALSAAFAPASSAQVPRDAAALAAELWRTMPAKAQRVLTSRASEFGVAPDHASLMREVLLRGARVGLFVCRELDLVLSQLGLDGDPSDFAIERSEGALNRALREHWFARALFAYAFSDAYLDALLDGS
jgi:hypothetical protein